MIRRGYGERSAASRWLLIIGVGSRETDFRWFDTLKEARECINLEHVAVYQLVSVRLQETVG